MGIKNQITEVIPFLLDYVPYSLNQNVICYTVDDMVSIELLPSVNGKTKINYALGAETSYITTLKIKNITNNVRLNVTIELNKNVFIIDNQIGVNQIQMDMNPQQTVEHEIKLNKRSLNEATVPVEFLTDITLRVKNYINNSLALTTRNEPLLQQRFLPEEIMVE